MKRWHSKHNPITEIRLAHFKSAKSAKIELAPLTVIVGENSAGKSTLFQSLLFLSQNASNRFSNSDLQAIGRCEMNGPLVALGSTRESIFDSTQNNPEDYFEIGVDWQFDARLVNRFRQKAGGKSSVMPTPAQHFELSFNTKFTSPKENSDSGYAWIKAIDMKTKSSGKEEVFSVMQKEGVEDSEATYLDSPFSSGYAGKVGSTKTESISDQVFEKTESRGFAELRFSGLLPIDGVRIISASDALLTLQFRILRAVAESDFYYLERTPQYLSEESKKYQQVNGDFMYHKFFESVDSAADIFVAEFWKHLIYFVKENENQNEMELSSIDYSEVPLIQLSQIPFDFFEISDTVRSGSILKNYENSNPGHIYESFRNFTRLIEKKIESTRDKYLDLDRTIRTTADLEIRYSKLPISNWSISSIASTQWNNFLATSIKYLGPLRERQAISNYYESSGFNEQIPIGVRGEYLARQLYINKKGQYPLPGNLLNQKMVTLLEAVELWVRELEIGSDIEVQSKGRSGLEIRVSNRTLEMLGTGVSQVLPVIVLCLLARPGNLVLLEQPELHLNPKIQQKMADFLVRLAGTGRQILVETHSEYLVTRLRLQALQNLDLSEQFNFIFVERDNLEGSSYKEVMVDDEGDLTEWPKGFFDHAGQDLREILKLVAVKRNLKNS